jgi:adenylate kinase
MNLVFTWIQWCGKWTQARLLIEKYWFEIVEMWWELRKIIKSWSDFWKTLKKILDEGNLTPPEMVAEIIKKVVTENKWKKMIFDGFIRNMWNKETFENVCDNYKVIFFELNEKKAKQRLLGRMFDPETQETFMTWTELNPKTWNKLIKRADDNEKSILTRINAFVKNTLPIVEIQKQEWKVIEINADQSINEVFSEIEKKLGLNKTFN